MIDFFKLSTLTPEQQADRRSGVGGSDVRDYILTGDWATLYDIKTGVKQEENIAFALAPMLGIYLEPFHRAWFEHTTKRVVHFDAKARQTYRLTDADFCLAHIDGYELPHGAPKEEWVPWEGKALNGFTKWEQAVEKYMPQLQWIMFVTGRPNITFSCLLGNSSCVHDTIPADTAYQMKLFELVSTFWREHMQKGIRPNTAGTPVIVPVAPPPPGEPIIVAMEGNNEWPELAERWIENRPKAAQFADDTEMLKALVPAGAGLVFGRGVKVTINKRGAKSVAEMDDKDKKMLPNHPRLVKYTDLMKGKNK